MSILRTQREAKRTKSSLLEKHLATRNADTAATVAASLPQETSCTTATAGTGQLVSLETISSPKYAFVPSEEGEKEFKVDDKERDSASTTGVTISTTTPGMAGVEQLVTIDGTEVLLMAHVKEEGGNWDDSARGNGPPLKMSLVAVDPLTRRSSRLSLKAEDIAAIACCSTAAEGTARAVGLEDGREHVTASVGRQAERTFAAVLKSLTLFNSRRKGVFILSYKGRKPMAPH